MKKVFLLLAVLATPAALFGQGTLASPQIALKNINGIVMPSAGATITVCAENTGGIPCSPALANAIFSDSSLTQSLPNPFTSDSYGNYQFAAATGQYTVTVTTPGFAGYSYQLSLGGSGGTGSGTVNNCSSSGLLGIYFVSGTAISCDPNLLDLGNLFSIMDSNGVSLPSNGTNSGAMALVGGTPPTVGSSPGQLPATGYFGWIGPSADSSPSVYLKPPTSAPSGTQYLGCGTPSGNISTCAWGTPSGGGNPTLDNCTPDQTVNSFYQPVSLTEYFYATWQFVFGTATYINCTVYIPTAATGATIVLDIAANDSTAGHTANFQTCDEVINTGTINLGSSLTCASAQTFTTTSTAYNRVTLTFNVQSTLSNGSILVVKILTATTGTAPTANMLVYPHFVL